MSEPKNKTCYLIIGLPRSGTSSIAQFLDNLGVYFGDPAHFLDTALLKHNPIFYELQWVNDLNDAVFAAWGSGYLQEVMPADADFDLPEMGPMAVQLRDLLLHEFGDRPLIGIKDPRICFTFPLWQKVLSELGYTIKIILTLRDPSAILRSNRALMPGRTSRWQRFYVRHLLAFRYFTRDLQVCRFDYDLLMQNPTQYGQTKADELGLEIKDPAAATAHLAIAHYHQQPDNHGTGDQWVDQVDAQLRQGTLDPLEYLQFRSIAALFTQELVEQESETAQALKQKDSYIRDVEALNRAAAITLAEQQRRAEETQLRCTNDFQQMVASKEDYIAQLAQTKDRHIAQLENLVHSSADEQQRLAAIIAKLEVELKKAYEDFRLAQEQIASLASDRSALDARCKELEGQSRGSAAQLADLNSRRMVRLMTLFDRRGRNRAGAPQ